MMGSLFFVLGLVWTTNSADPLKSNIFTVSEIILAIPLLYVSSLAYSKIGYSEKYPLWDTFGWFTNNMGSIFILNVVGLMTASIHEYIALAYFSLILILMAIYSTINIVSQPHKKSEKIFKFLFFLLVLVVGGLLPALF